MFFSLTDFLSSRSVMTLAEVIEPKVLNASLSDSSVIESSKFLTYKFTPTQSSEISHRVYPIIPIISCLQSS